MSPDCHIKAINTIYYNNMHIQTRTYWSNILLLILHFLGDKQQKPRPLEWPRLFGGASGVCIFLRVGQTGTLVSFNM